MGDGELSPVSDGVKSQPDKRLAGILNTARRRHRGCSSTDDKRERGIHPLPLYICGALGTCCKTWLLW